MPIEIDEENLRSGLLGLLVGLVEVIKEVLEREALRRMESGLLKDEEINRLGKGLMELDLALEKIKNDNEIEGTVEKIRSELDLVIEDTINIFTNSEEETDFRRITHV